MAAVPAEGSAGTSPRRSPIDSHPATGSIRRAVTSATTPAGHAADLAIVRAVLDGDRDRFRILVDRESGVVARACFRVLGDQHEAEDVTQEAFVLGYRSLATWRGEGSFGAWIARIAVRLAIRQLRRRRVVSWLQAADAATGEVGSRSSGEASEPERAVLVAERAAATRRAVANLAEPYREVVALRFFGEQSLNEIAAVTGRPVGTVKTHLRRGLLRLRQELEPGGVR